jgi:hypothetical protein
MHPRTTSGRTLLFRWKEFLKSQQRPTCRQALLPQLHERAQRKSRLI